MQLTSAQLWLSTSNELDYPDASDYSKITHCEEKLCLLWVIRSSIRATIKSYS